jgi:hypothetical protein
MIGLNTTQAEDLPDASQARDYFYEVFVSYPREKQHERWVQQVFVDQLRRYLTNALGWEARIFHDRTGIGSGDEWPERLKVALARSKIMIPVWSVEYFSSDWCMAECSVIRQREDHFGFRTKANPAGLIHPVRLFDGRNYPPFAQRVQDGIDCNDFNHLTEEHTKFEPYLKLVEAIRNWAPQLAAGIERAPLWVPDMLSKAWLDDLVEAWVGEPDFAVPNVPFSPPSMATPKR